MYHSFTGYPRELAEKMVGVKTTMKVVDMGESKMFVHFVVDGHPELSSCFVCQEGIENNVNIPLFGGKVVFTFNSTKKGYHSVVESEGMGKWEMEEEYTAEGITSVSNYSFILNKRVALLLILWRFFLPTHSY